MLVSIDSVVEQLFCCCYQFHINGEWWTWIDYDQFHSLLAEGRAFTATDYMEKTPPWAVFGATEHGFDPCEERFYRKKQRSDERSSDDCGS